MKAQYLEALQGFLDVYSEEMGTANISYSLTDISQPLDQALLAFLTQGKRLQ